jgi:hypothetical protein
MTRVCGCDSKAMVNASSDENRRIDTGKMMLV